MMLWLIAHFSAAEEIYSKSFKNAIIFGTGISVGGLHRLDKFISKR